MTIHTITYENPDTEGRSGTEPAGVTGGTGKVSSGPTGATYEIPDDFGTNVADNPTGTTGGNTNTTPRIIHPRDGGGSDVGSGVIPIAIDAATIGKTTTKTDGKTDTGTGGSDTIHIDFGGLGDLLGGFGGGSGISVPAATVTPDSGDNNDALAGILAGLGSLIGGGGKEKAAPTPTAATVTGGSTASSGSGRLIVGVAVIGIAVAALWYAHKKGVFSKAVKAVT